jgi:hypothetical protein
MRSGVILVAVGVLVGASTSLAFGALRADDGTADSHTVAELEIEPSMTGGPRGVGTSAPPERAALWLGGRVGAGAGLAARRALPRPEQLVR